MLTVFQRPPRPILLKDGLRIQFPLPAKNLKAPKKTRAAWPELNNAASIQWHLLCVFLAHTVLDSNTVNVQRIIGATIICKSCARQAYSAADSDSNSSATRTTVESGLSISSQSSAASSETLEADLVPLPAVLVRSFMILYFNLTNPFFDS